MFNKDFFPTPTDVINSMLFGVDIQNKVILEPHGGKGNIVDYLKDNGVKEVISCEKNDDLRKMLSSKCRIVKSDFLELKKDEVSHINCIIANPPFSCEETHILHMWDIAPDGCEIITLCNNSMYENSRYNYRLSIKKIVEEFGNYTFLGDVFSNAERKTGVEIGLIKLYKPKRESENEFEGYFDENDEIEEQGNGIMPFNELRNIVNRYVGAVNLFNSAMESANQINEMIKPINGFSSICFGAFQSNNQIDRETFKKELQKSAWKAVFNKLDMGKYVTTTVMADINKFVETQTKVPFTMSNIKKMFEMIVGTHDDRMNRILVESFDTICGFSEDNKLALETWKTNSGYMVNRRFIHPYIVDKYSWSSKNKVYVHWDRGDKVDDIAKALCNLTGVKYETIPRLYTHCNSNNFEYGQWHEWGFFRIRGYKKGTMHFEFIDEDVWYKFNQAVAKIRGYNLPKQTNTGKKSKK